MNTWKERYEIPKMDTVHVAEGYDNPCEECEEWGETCEVCRVSVPLVADEYEVFEIEMGVMNLCGIPVGHPYQIN